MRFKVLACDYDGTLATDGRVSETTIAALERAKNAGHTLLLVTGRRLEDLIRVFPRLDLFERVVTENGGVLCAPEEDRQRVLAPAPPDAFVAELRKRQVVPLEIGRTIVATWQPHETTLLEVIRDLGLELEIVFNKGAVMVLPIGVSKCSGLMAALGELKLSPHNAVSVGDAENDHAFLRASECAVAVANAVPALKATADWVTSGARGQGVEELANRLIDDDLKSLQDRLARHDVVLGRRRPGGTDITLRPYVTRMLVVGQNKAGKSSMTLGVIERLADQQFQYCLIDPEGDYERMPDAVQLGTTDRAPAIPEVLTALDRPQQNVVIYLLGVPRADRPEYMARLLPDVQKLRLETSRPHWLVIDEAHHVFPSDWGSADEVAPSAFGGLVMISVRPEAIARTRLGLVNMLVSAGQTADVNIAEFARLSGREPPALPRTDLSKGEALVWNVEREPPVLVDLEPARGDRQRHRRKYAEGELPPDRSFYFRGPGNRLNLRAYNLVLFVELAQGVDDETWLYHLHRGDYSTWVREMLKEEELADDVAEVEHDRSRSAAESRERVRWAIDERYAPPS